MMSEPSNAGTRPPWNTPSPAGRPRATNQKLAAPRPVLLRGACPCKKRKSMRPFWASFCLLLLTEVAVSETKENSWESLRAVKIGHKIQVVDHNLKSHDGTFSSVSDDALIFQVGSQQTIIQKADVLRVSSREHLERGKKALIGAGIGLLVGGVVVSATGTTQERAGLYAVFGAAIGAALPAGHPTIYRAERQPNPIPH